MLDGETLFVAVAVTDMRAEADPHPLPGVELELPEIDVVDDVVAVAETDFDLTIEAVIDDEAVTEIDDILEREARGLDVTVAVTLDVGVILAEWEPDGVDVLVREEVVDTVAV